MKKRVIIDPRFLPREVKELRVYDGRPAFLFADWNGKLPLKRVNKEGVPCCPYCNEPLVYTKCRCFSFRKAEEFNASLR